MEWAEIIQRLEKDSPKALEQDEIFQQYENGTLSANNTINLAVDYAKAKGFMHRRS